MRSSHGAPHSMLLHLPYGMQNDGCPQPEVGPSRLSVRRITKLSSGTFVHIRPLAALALSQRGRAAQPSGSSSRGRSAYPLTCMKPVNKSAERIQNLVRRITPRMPSCRRHTLRQTGDQVWIPPPVWVVGCETELSPESISIYKAPGEFSLCHVAEAVVFKLGAVLRSCSRACCCPTLLATLQSRTSSFPSSQ